MQLHKLHHDNPYSTVVYSFTSEPLNKTLWYRVLVLNVLALSHSQISIERSHFSNAWYCTRIQLEYICTTLK